MNMSTNVKNPASNETTASRIDRVARERRISHNLPFDEAPIPAHLQFNREELGAAGGVPDMAINQAGMFQRGLANIANAPLLDEGVHDEPSNFQAWYVRSANSSNNRPLMDDGAGEECAESEPGEDDRGDLESDSEVKLERQLFRSLSLDQDLGNSLPSNHNHFLVEAPSNASLPVTGAVPRRNSSFYTHNVNQGPGTLYNWQATKTTVKERFAFMFNNEILADVHFKVGRGGAEQRIPAHKFVLSVGSAVFDAMFNSTLATAEEEIFLPDVEPSAFLALLRFLYSDEVQIGPETVMTTLYTAKKYAVPALEKACVDFLKRNLSPDNAFMLLTQARLFDEPQLAALCLETIDKNTPEALSAEGFIDIDIDTLSVVLDRDSLRIKESKLFTAVLRWSEAECQRQALPVTSENKRSVLGRLLFQIRFPLMTVEEFAQGPAQSGILTDRETVSLFLHFTVNPKPAVGFLDVPRCSMTGKEQTVCRFQQIESRWGYSGTSDKIRFIVDRRIFVVGFGLYGSIHGPSEYDVTLQIIHTGSGRLLGSNEISFSSDGTNATFRVMFKEPIEIQPNTNYTACTTLKGLDSHYGTKGLRKVSVDCPNGGKVTFQFSYAAGNNNGTSVEDGQIPEIIFYT